MTTASQLPKIPNLPRSDPDSPLPGFITFRHLAAMAGISPNNLRAVLYDKEAPRLEPAHRIGNSYLYPEFEANDWLQRLQEWRDAAPLRAAARKLEQEQRVLLKLEADQKRHQQQKEADAALEKMKAEIAARDEAFRKEVEETERRLGMR